MKLTDLPTRESPALENLDLGKDREGAFRIVDAVGVGTIVTGVLLADLAKTQVTRWSVILASAAAAVLSTEHWKDRIAHRRGNSAER
jgi:hypothetical protein